MYDVKISFGKPKYTARCQIRGAKINFDITPWTKPGGKHFFKISQFWDFLQHFSYIWQNEISRAEIQKMWKFKAFSQQIA